MVFLFCLGVEEVSESAPEPAALLLGLTGIDVLTVPIRRDHGDQAPFLPKAAVKCLQSGSIVDLLPILTIFPWIVRE